MKALNIGRILIENRHRRGITQEDLAQYIGVSKASVSKWETATTYPDITLLPQLATFFHISIDELMGYEPQMTKEDIRKLYWQLSQDFSGKPFEEVMEQCHEIARKYFSCTPLLFQLGCLYVNHCMLADTPEKASAIIDEARELFLRVREESDEVELKTQAVNMEAFCLLRLGKANEVIDLLNQSVQLRMAPEPLLSSAFLMAGDAQEARRVLQAGIYQTVIELLNMLLPYLSLCEADSSAFEKTYERILTIADTFQLKTLHPTVLMTLYLTIAQEFMKHGSQEQALDMLDLYTTLALSDIYPLKLQGDSYFDLLEGWLEEMLPLGSDLPRAESSVRKSIRDAVTDNPVFAPLSEHIRFKNMVQRLNLQLT